MEDELLRKGSGRFDRKTRECPALEIELQLIAQTFALFKKNFS